MSGEEQPVRKSKETAFKESGFGRSIEGEQVWPPRIFNLKMRSPKVHPIEFVPIEPPSPETIEIMKQMA